MNSKYFDLKKLKQSFDPPEIHKNNRKQTKPKKNLKTYIGHDNQTQSDYQLENYQKQKKRQKLPSKKFSKEIIKSHQPSPKKYFKAKLEESSSSNELNFNKQYEAIKRKKSFQTGRQLTQFKQESNFIGQLNEYLNELKKSKFEKSEDPNSKNKTLLLNRLSFREKEKLQNEIENSSRLEKKIKRQKSINRNLQKCIIQIQKVLWDRSDQLEILEEHVRRSVRQRQNFIRKASDIDNNNLTKTIFFNQQFRNKKQYQPEHKNPHIFSNEQSTPINNSTKKHSKQRPVSIYYRSNSETDQESSATFKQNPRRKTETMTNIQKVLQKTLDSKGLNRTKLLKTYNKFERQDLNNL